VAGCELIGNLFGCNAAWTQYVTCVNGATPLTCGADGKANANGACLGQAAAFDECAAGTLVTAATADGGTGG
jgi:hypothetical protein